MSHEDRVESAGGPVDQARGVSRRGLLTAAVTAGVGLAVTGPMAYAKPGPGPGPGLVGAPAIGATACEFRMRVEETGTSGETITAYGYLMRAAGLTDGDLFSGGAPSDATALFTVAWDGSRQKIVFDQDVHALDDTGTMTVYQRSSPGASWADSSSFKVGTPVAQFGLTLQVIRTVFAPGKSIETWAGDMSQTVAGVVGGGPTRFGRVNGRDRFFAAGLGVLLDPVTRNYLVELAGNWTTLP
jgi:hypothetical protein